MSKHFWWILAVTAGVLLGLSFPPMPFAWPAWICFVPLSQLVTRNDWRTSGAMAFAAHLIAYGIAGWWVVRHPEPYTRWASAAGIVWVAALATAPWIVASMARSALRRDLWIVAGIGSIEMFHLYTDLGFPWTAVGHTQAGFEPFNQMAEFGGVTILSIWVLAVNIAISRLIDAGRANALAPASALVVLILVPALGGSFLLNRVTVPDDVQPGDELNVFAIQPSLSVGLWSDAESTARVDSLVRITNHLLDRPGIRPSEIDLILWPETVIPPSDLRDAGDRQALADLAATWDKILLTGGIEVVRDRSGSPYRNAAFLVIADSAEVRSYRKLKLVPFAEHVPYSNLVPALRRLAVPAGGVWGYEPGTRLGLFVVNDRTRMGVLICFESVFGNLSRRLADAGSSALIVLTQDGWWGDSAGHRQHVAFNRLRAIETRLPVIQVAATGVSAHIDRTGRIVQSVDWMERGALAATVQPRPSDTLYIRFGDWPGGLCALMVLILILTAQFRRNREP